MLLHTERPKWNCSICGRELCDENNLLRHMMTHGDRKCDECQLCNRKCFDLQKHIERVHSKPPEPVSCDICHKQLKNEANLEAHKTIHFTDRKKIVCEICAFPIYDSVQSIATYMAFHKRGSPNMCHFCKEYPD